MKYIYVSSKEGRDYFLKQGYVLIKELNKSDVYVFENNVGKFSKNEIKNSKFNYVLSNTLTF